jgi:hypothetical protein
VKGGFGKHVFLMLSLVKMYVYLKVSFEMCMLKCVKKFGYKSGENKGVYVIL